MTYPHASYDLFLITMIMILTSSIVVVTSRGANTSCFEAFAGFGGTGTPATADHQSLTLFGDKRIIGRTLMFRNNLQYSPIQKHCIESQQPHVVPGPLI